MRVKGFMPPKGGLTRQTPTGRAVGRNVVWHNFLYCSGICYALGYFIGIAVCQKNRRCTIAPSSYGTSPIMCFYLGITEHLIPLVPPLACHCNMDV